MKESDKSLEQKLIQTYFGLLFLLLLSGCSTTQAVVETTPIPPSEAAVRAEKPPVFNGKTVGDLVDYNLDLLSAYNKLSIRHDALVDWINNYNKKQ